jgi:hypothetical protein
MDINGSSEIGNYVILMRNPRGATDTQQKGRSGKHSFFYYYHCWKKKCYGAIRHYI